MQISFETPDQPDVRALISELDAYLYSLFGDYPADPYSVFMQKHAS